MYNDNRGQEKACSKSSLSPSLIEQSLLGSRCLVYMTVFVIFGDIACMQCY